jgi:hypothetical protein
MMISDGLRVEQVAHSHNAGKDAALTGGANVDGGLSAA